MKRILFALIALACLLPSQVEARRLPWCGIYMGKYFGLHDRALWVARNWASVGTAAAGPSDGVVVVWAHHVGVIVGKAANGEWLVHSGNDGNAIRTRPRSLRGAIAFRHVGASGSAYANLKVEEQGARRRNKNLVALAVEGGDGPRVTRLQQPRARARFAVQPVSVEFSLWHPSTMAFPAERAHKVAPKQRKPVLKSASVLIGFGGPVTDAEVAGASKVTSAGHRGPRR